MDILRGCYGLQQSGRLANNLLQTRLEKAGYYKAATTLVIWINKCRPIQFFLLLDKFVIEYVCKEHALHFLKTLEQNYKITTDWEGIKLAGIDLAWYYFVWYAN